jgi:hypothetical protein
MKVIERAIEPGKWRYGFSRDLPGHFISGVFIKGMRNRLWPLWQVGVEEFKLRFPHDTDTDRPPHVLCGTPSMWMQQGTNVYLWPAPTDGWILQVRMMEK